MVAMAMAFGVAVGEQADLVDLDAFLADPLVL